MISTIRYNDLLEEAGFTKKQAEISIRVLLEIMETNLVTKIDFIELRSELKEDINKLRSELKEDINQVSASMDLFKTDVRHELKSLKNELVIKLGGIVVVSIMTGIALVAAVVKYL